MDECNSFFYEAPAVHTSGTETAGLDETEPEPSQTQARAAATGFSKTRPGLTIKQGLFGQ